MNTATHIIVIFLVSVASVRIAAGAGREMLMVGINQAYRWVEDSNATTVGFNSFSELPNGQQPTAVDFYSPYAQIAALADLSKAVGNPQASKLAYFDTGLTAIGLAVNFPRNVGLWSHAAVDRDWWYIPEVTNKIRRVYSANLTLPAADTNGFPLTACSSSSMMPWTVITNRTRMFYTCGTFAQQVGNSANFLRGEVWMCANKHDLIGTPCQRLDLIAPDTFTGIDLVEDNLYYIQAASRQIWKYNLTSRTKTLFHTIECPACQITVNATYSAFDVPMRIRFLSDGRFYVNMFWHPTSYNSSKVGLIWRIDSAGQFQDRMMDSSTGIGVLDFLWMNTGDYYYSERQMSLFVDPPVGAAFAPEESPIGVPNAPPVTVISEPPVAAPKGAPAVAPQEAPSTAPALAPPSGETVAGAPKQTESPVDKAPMDPPAQTPLFNESDTSNNNSGNQSSSSMLIPAVAGAVAGAVALIALVIIVVVVIRKKKEEKKNGACEPSGPGGEAGVELSVTYGPMTPNEQGAAPERTRRRANTAQMSKWQTDKSELEFGDKIGSGNFGTVFEGSWRGAPVAIKQCKASLNTQDFIDETYLMAQLRPHKAVCQIYGVCNDESDMYLIMELIPGGNLLDLLRQKQVKPDDKIRIVQDLVSGMIHLHAEKILHRDLAARNVLMTSDGDAKLSDFGMSHAGAESFKAVSSSGPIRWMAPESLKSHVYSTKTDVYAFGVLVWEIITDGEVPLAHMTTSQVGVARRDRNLTPEIPDDAPAVLADIIRKCWSLDPDDRPTFKQIANTLGKLRPAKSRMRYSMNITAAAQNSGIESNSNSSRPASAAPLEAVTMVQPSTAKSESPRLPPLALPAQSEPDTPRKPMKIQTPRKQSREDSSEAGRKRSRSRANTVGSGSPPGSPKARSKAAKGESPAIPLSKLVLLRNEGADSDQIRPRTARTPRTSNKASPRGRKESTSSQQSRDSDKSARTKTSLTGH